MIKLTEVAWVRDHVLRLKFSDGSAGEHDFAAFVARDGALVASLRDPQQFRRCFLELGALGWPNGLELGAASLQRRMREAGELRLSDAAA